eukprot:CAMPEP_0181229732 /NCGR_PEP_ID=MMETSP1096-20121128/34066_1 /TAXON_ID=156174 ORGANISM="Chrysochromulina ericina, Strain CCMP281" /NCGR_SAMPLE_ID=MMETSP1096 /ASSEMBLY_ACC=CAM_ASM_000453 /LENGTH=58 /DNA_ID=CAMNT_0023323399 /DNA_START=176 /DNA_END=349 /DNA_ORIENTATION=+
MPGRNGDSLPMNVELPGENSVRGATFGFGNGLKRLGAASLLAAYFASFLSSTTISLAA